MRSNAGLWLAAAAVALWAILAPLGVALQHVPPLLLTGLSLLVGGLVALPFNGLHVSAWRVSWRSLALGVYGLFGFHFLLFMSLRLAPPVAANLVNYLWPLGIVVMAPLFLPSVKWRWLYALAAVLGFGGCGHCHTVQRLRYKHAPPSSAGGLCIGFGVGMDLEQLLVT